MRQKNIHTRSYACDLAPLNAADEDLELAADSRQLERVRIRAINAQWAERCAFHLFRKRVVRTERIDDEDLPSQQAQPELVEG